MNKPLTIAVLFAAVIAGCEEKAPPAAPKPAAPAPKAPAPKTPAPNQNPPATPPVVAPSAVPPAVASAGTIGVMNLTFKLPDGWKAVTPSNPMRLAEVQVPDASGDAAKMCTLVMSTAGGDVASNIARWQGQVTGADGQPSKSEPKVRTVEGMTVTSVEMTGSFMNMGETTPHTNWTMRGAVIETASGMLFVKMTGPAEQMAAAGKAMDSMIDGVKKQ